MRKRHKTCWQLVHSTLNLYFDYIFHDGTKCWPRPAQRNGVQQKYQKSQLLRCKPSAAESTPATWSTWAVSLNPYDSSCPVECCWKQSPMEMEVMSLVIDPLSKNGWTRHAPFRLPRLKYYWTTRIRHRLRLLQNGKICWLGRKLVINKWMGCHGFNSWFIFAQLIVHRRTATLRVCLLSLSRL